MCTWKSSLNHHVKCRKNSFGSSEFCLFHNPNKNEEEAKLFWDIINFPNYRNLLESLVNGENPILPNLIILTANFDIKNRGDMTGFVFPELNKENGKYSMLANDYHEINFGDWFPVILRFDEAIFNCSITFGNFEFLSFASFDHTTFNKYVNFRKATFNLDAYFKNVKFSNVIDNTEPVFKGTKFLGNKFEFIGDRGAISFKGIEFDDDTAFLLKVDFGTTGYGETSYRVAKKQALNNHNYKLADQYHYQERHYRHHNGFEWKDFIQLKLKGWDKLYYIFNERGREQFFSYLRETVSKYTIGYGLKPFRLLYWCTLIIFLFPFLFMFHGLYVLEYSEVGNATYTKYINYNFDLCQLNRNFDSDFILQFIEDYSKAWFYSVSSFSTASFGTIPINLGGQILTFIEMGLGVLFFGLFTATYLNKISR
jgi:hypothetical protein